MAIIYGTDINKTHSNENMALLYRKLQELKVSIIRDLPDEYNKMLDFIKTTKENGSYNSMILTNSKAKYILKNDEVDELYSNFAVLPAIERKYFVGDKLEDFQSHLIDDLNDDLNNVSLYESTPETINAIFDYIDVNTDDDNTKLLLLESIMTKQRKIVEDINENNNELIHQVALKTGKATDFNSPSDDRINDLKIELYNEVYKSINTYKYGTKAILKDEDNNPILDDNGKEQLVVVQFSTLLTYKLKSKGGEILKKHYDEIEKKNNSISLDLDEDEERSSIQDVVAVSMHNNSSNIFDDGDILNQLYSEDKSVNNSKNIIKKLIHNDDSSKATNINNSLLNHLKDSPDGIYETIDFIKGGLHSHGVDIEADPKWVETFDKYVEYTKEDKEEKVLVAIIEKEFNNVSKLETKRNMINDLAKNNNNLSEFNVAHRSFINRLIKKESNHNTLFINKHLDAQSMDIGLRASYGRENYYGSLLDKKRMNEGIEHSIDSKLIDIADVEVKDFEYIKKYSIEEDTSALPNMSADQFDNLKGVIAKLQSEDDYSKVSSMYVGKYQLDAQTLADYGLIDAAKLENLVDSKSKDEILKISEEFIKDDSNWNKEYAGSLKEFLGNESLQESLMDHTLLKNYKEMNDYVSNNDQFEKINSLDELRPWEVAGLLSVAHVGGTDNALKLAMNGQSHFKDTALGGEILEKYYKVGKEATMVDVNQSLFNLDTKSFHNKNHLDDFTTSEMMFNPLSQAEYFSKEIGELFSSISIAINNHRYEKAQEEIEKHKIDNVLGNVMNNYKEAENKEEYSSKKTSKRSHA